MSDIKTYEDIWDIKTYQDIRDIKTYQDIKKLNFLPIGCELRLLGIAVIVLHLAVYSVLCFEGKEALI